MKYNFKGRFFKSNQKNIFEQNERLATNVTNPPKVSTFDISSRHLTTFNSCKLIPVLCKEMLPGDIVDLNVSTMIRLATPQASTMESSIIDLSAFFVPNRVVWEKWVNLMGENAVAGPQIDVEQVPIIEFDDNNFVYTENDVAAYMGFPINVKFQQAGLPVNALFFKAYGKIWNDYYRDQNLQSEIDIFNNGKLDSNVKVSEYVNSPLFNQTIQIGKGLAPVSRLTDYFSTCLPYPQKGQAVEIGNLNLQALKIINDPAALTGNLFSPKWYTDSGVVVNNKQPLIHNTDGLTYSTGDTSPAVNRRLNLGLGVGLKSGFATPTYNINDLRLSIAVQHMLELDARGGTRYTEYLLNHFGIKAGDSRLQRAEYIGGFRRNLEIGTIIQSSFGDAASPLGKLQGVSVNQHSTDEQIKYACEEHGILFVVATVRPQINYSQGLDKQFTKTFKYDYYDPLFANIGEQPVRNYELYVSDKPVGSFDAATINAKTFGYNEAWAEYRYSKNILSGYLSVNSALTLANLYSYTEKYTTTPLLSKDWMSSSDKVIGDTLLLNTGKLEYINQFIGDFYFNFKITRPLPIYSIPGIPKI